MNKVLSLAEIDQLTKPRVRVTATQVSPNPGTSCVHTFQPDRTLVARGNEFPTKRCVKCNLWLIVPADEVIDNIVNIGDWLG